MVSDERREEVLAFAKRVQDIYIIRKMHDSHVRRGIGPLLNGVEEDFLKSINGREKLSPRQEAWWLKIRMNALGR